MNRYIDDTRGIKPVASSSAGKGMKVNPSDAITRTSAPITCCGVRRSCRPNSAVMDPSAQP